MEPIGLMAMVYILCMGDTGRTLPAILLYGIRKVTAYLISSPMALIKSTDTANLFHQNIHPQIEPRACEDLL